MIFFVLFGKLIIHTSKDENMKKINEYINIKEAAQFIGVTQNTLRNWEREKKIAVHRNPLNRYRLYKKEDLEQLLKSIHQA